MNRNRSLKSGTHTGSGLVLFSFVIAILSAARGRTGDLTAEPLVERVCRKRFEIGQLQHETGRALGKLWLARLLGG